MPKARRDRWRAFGAAFFGWMLDGYDFTILTLVLLEIQRDLVIDNAAVGALGTATLLARPLGGLAAGAAADRWVGKLPLMISILWFSGFAFLSGFSTSYSMLFFLRTMFGLGMGGEWAAEMPLVLEHWGTLADTRIGSRWNDQSGINGQRCSTPAVPVLIEFPRVLVGCAADRRNCCRRHRTTQRPRRILQRAEGVRCDRADGRGRVVRKPLPAPRKAVGNWLAT